MSVLMWLCDGCHNGTIFRQRALSLLPPSLCRCRLPHRLPSSLRHRLCAMWSCPMLHALVASSRSASRSARLPPRSALSGPIPIHSTTKVSLLPLLASLELVSLTCRGANKRWLRIYSNIPDDSSIIPSVSHSNQHLLSSSVN
jgi:hypothetical protein